MTLTMAWVRVVGNTEELVVASDSRLGGGHRWDVAPKIVPLSRDDSVLAFAGATDLAYPIILQMANAVDSYDRSATRLLSLTELKGHLVRVANDMLRQETSFPSNGRQPPDVVLLLAGYCWKYGGFRIWTIQFDQSIGKFTHQLTPNWRGRSNQVKRLAIVGNHQKEAKDELIARLKTKGKMSNGGFDMEPLDVLLGMIDNPKFGAIGGNPQLVKIYKSLKTVPFVINRNGTRSLFGRSLLDYEAPDRFPILTLGGIKVER